MSLWFFGSALGIIESEAEFGYSVIMGAGMGLFFGIAQAFQAYARGKATIGETFVKLFIVPIAMLILGIGLLIACGVVWSFSKDPLTTTICLILLLALFGGGGGTIVAIIFER